MSEKDKQTYEEQLANSKNAAQRLKAHWDDLSPTERRRAGIAAVAVGVGVPAAIVGVNVLASQHTDTVIDNMQNQQDPNQQHDFEQNILPQEEVDGYGPMNPAPSDVDPAKISNNTGSENQGFHYEWKYYDAATGKYVDTAAELTSGGGDIEPVMVKVDDGPDDSPAP